MPAQNLSDYLAYLLASANRSMRAGMAQSIAEEAFNEEQWRILQALSDEEGRAMGELAEQVLMNHPALTKNVDKLVSAGLIHRAAHASDNRKVLVYITDLGLETVQRMTLNIDAHHVAIEEALGARKTEQLKRLLEQFIAEASSRQS